MNVRQSIEDLKAEITEYRHAMHENPQTAYEETFANELVTKKLSEWDIPYESGIAVTGVVATIEGKTNSSDHAIGLRADMDALDIIEEANKPWVSKTPGKMHGCGHDGHTAMLLGAAKYLKEHNDFDGIVYLIFQPAEEGFRGAHKMIEEGLFKRFPCNSVYAVHNWPQLPKGTAATNAGPIMASADKFNLTVKGLGGHAAMPHRTIDPVVVGSHIVTALQTLMSRTRHPSEPAVLSITNFHAGTGAHNVIPDDAVMSGTLRTYNQDLRQELSKRIESTARLVAQSMGADIEFEFEFILDSTVNTPQETKTCVEIMRGILGEHNVNPDVTPSLGGEDFGAMLMEKPGCYIWIGQAEKDEGSNHNHGLHTPRYDFNDDIIPIGIEYWVRIVETVLSSSEA